MFSDHNETNWKSLTKISGKSQILVNLNSTSK